MGKAAKWRAFRPGPPTERYTLHTYARATGATTPTTAAAASAAAAAAAVAVAVAGAILFCLCDLFCLLMVWSFVNGIPRAAMTGLMTQMTLAGVHLGDKYQDHNAMMTYTGIVFLVLQRLMRCRFNDTIPNLPFASAFRLIWDGITLRNGATVIPILVLFTNHSGEIVSEVVDIPLSKGSQRPRDCQHGFQGAGGHPGYPEACALFLKGRTPTSECLCAHGKAKG